MIVRPAQLSDAKKIARVHVNSWRTTYKGIIPDEVLDNLSYEKREERWATIIPNEIVFVAETKEGEIVGFSTGGKERSGHYNGYVGELSSIYILEEHQGKGIGKLLVKPIIQELEKLSIYSMIVLVLEENDSRLFYEALGAKIIDKLQVEIGGKKLNELVYGWDNTKTIFK
mgnify:FL=1